jgi:hypothetical protein
MGSNTLMTHAAELRARALCATPEERDDLLYLADEYERLAETAPDAGPETVFLPK